MAQLLLRFAFLSKEDNFYVLSFGQPHLYFKPFIYFLDLFLIGRLAHTTHGGDH